MKFRSNHLLVYLLIGSTLLMYYNAWMNLHIHQDESGKYVTVSHPYDSDKDFPSKPSEHSHSKLEFIFFTIISIIEAIVTYIFLVYLGKLLLQLPRIPKFPIIIKSVAASPYIIRGPPAFQF